MHQTWTTKCDSSFECRKYETSSYPSLYGLSVYSTSWTSKTQVYMWLQKPEDNVQSLNDALRPGQVNQMVMTPECINDTDAAICDSHHCKLKEWTTEMNLSRLHKLIWAMPKLNTWHEKGEEKIWPDKK